MGLKNCEKCGEEVDEAKAFCPECGNPFVEEEKREGSSEFDNYAGTINFSKSVYGRMLSEMEMEISKPATPESQPIQPTEPEIKPNPNLDSLNNIPPKNEPIQQNNKSGRWIIFALIGALFVIFLGIAVLLFLLFYFDVFSQLFKVK
jgi:hypothetical protein